MLAAAASIAGTTAATAGAAPAGPTAADLLTAAELPAASGHWTAGAVQPGVPGGNAERCLRGVLPANRAVNRTYDSASPEPGPTRDAAWAQQTVTLVRDQGGAQLIAKEATQELERCAPRWARESGASVVGKRYASLPYRDGVVVYGLLTKSPDGMEAVTLYAVGRGGRAVTALKLVHPGPESTAPLRQFEKSARLAVERLRG